MSLAKALSSAYMPLSAAIVTGELYDPMVPASAEIGVFSHGYTYSGHPVACAVAAKVIEIYERDNLFERAATVGEYLQTRLQEFAEHPLVGEVRGVGLIAALELVANKGTRQAFTDYAPGVQCMKACESHGLIVRAMGNSIALCPPLIITREQVDELIEKLTAGLADTLDFVNRENLLVA